MAKQFLLYSFFLFLSVGVRAQAPPATNYFDSLVVPDSINFFFLGENHQMNNSQHKIQLIKHLYAQWGVNEIGLEYPRTLEKRVNDYIQNGNLSAFEEIKEVYFQNRRDQAKLLEGLHELNKGLCQANKLHVNCFDMDLDSRDVALIEIESMLEYHMDSRLDSLLNMVRINLDGLSLDEVIHETRKELIKNFKLYYQILDDDIYVLNDALDGAEISGKYEDLTLNNDSLSLDRENFISRSLDAALTRSKSKKMLVFIGSFHISNLEEDDISESTSSNFILQNEYDRNTHSVVTIYHNNKQIPFSQFIPFYSGFIDYLKLDLFSFFRQHKKQFLYLGKDYLISSEDIYARFDGILVKDCVRRWR